MATVTRRDETFAAGSPANPLLQLIDCGQSYWIDNLSRRLIRSGDLERRVRAEGLRGVTSNPAIFCKAISAGTDYDEQVRELVDAGRPLEEIYEELVVTDIREACDVLRRVYDSSDGADGFVSLEVSPYLVHDTEASCEEARRLWSSVDRPNLLIKIPGSPAGVPAVERLLYEGINVNITLLFSIESYEAVAWAYVRALERRLDEGRSVDRIASVASFFLSRIDVLTDQLLGHRMWPGDEPGHGPRPEMLLGRAAVANAKLAYRSFLEIFAGERWARLAAEGARVQRVLWASTSTKDPLYGDVRYVEPLIGPGTVNTMPESTIAAFADHGRIRPRSVEEDLEEARRALDGLRAVGVDFDAVTWQLINEGAQKFLDPYDALMGALAAKRTAILGDRAVRQEMSPGAAKSAISATASALHARRFGPRLFRRDPSIWTLDPDIAPRIARRLGWLDSLDVAPAVLGEIRGFAAEVKEAGTRYVVLLGMGGSSLCPAVVARTFGAAPGWPELIVLDDTDPDAVRAVESRVDLNRTLFLVASKSGTTVETLSLYRYFRERVAAAGEPRPGRRFVALTDPGTPLEREARESGFLRHFPTPEDVGGRYSALTAFGLLPMTLLGVDVDAVLASAREVRVGSGPAIPLVDNPAVGLGAALGALARRGRDKVTFIASPEVDSFPMWVEQLLAESTGKDGRGLVPVVGEPGGRPEEYGPDRVFVRLGVRPGGRSELTELEAAGHPVIRIDLPRLESLGGEFLRWELATATAGAVLGVNPFDEPNVSESKRSTAVLLEEWGERGTFSESELAASEGGLRIEFDRKAAWARELTDNAPNALLTAFAELARPRSYLALLAYFRATPARDELLRTLRARLRARTRAATTLGYGPRYLHSTGQLHKGGPDRGAFLLLTADPAGDLPIPGSPYGFAVLHRAQALGDFRALAARGRRVIRVHLGREVEEGLRRILQAFS
ncbi:MAG: bifunctional transaldolase/phosoglucose isomerase [Gemmatimonadota bacterium]